MLRKAAIRIGADDSLTRIDTLMDWQWCSPTRKRGGSGTAGSVRRATKMKSNGFARPDAAQTRKASSTRSTRAPANRAGSPEPGFDTMVKGAKARAGIGRQGLWPARPTGTLCAVTTVTGSYVNGRPVIDPRVNPLLAPEKREGRRICNRCLRDCAMPGHDEAPPDSSGWPKQKPDWRWRQSGGTCGEPPLNRQTPAIA